VRGLVRSQGRLEGGPGQWRTGGGGDSSRAVRQVAGQTVRPVTEAGAPARKKKAGAVG
jgi:hypothetical protein